jgi:hypothetical protein
MSVISFYNLIKNYQIEIPVIQRDYAQGRDNTKASDVRRSIVKSMINSIFKLRIIFFVVHTIFLY